MSSPNVETGRLPNKELMCIEPPAQKITGDFALLNFI
jgi:hypothetical protein